jgi:hypothetical protein
VVGEILDPPTTGVGAKHGFPHARE